MKSVFGVDAIGSSGGLAMFWKEDVVLTLRSFSRNYIDMEVIGNNEEEEWRLTGFYGEPNQTRRGESWNTLRLLASQSFLPWICFGDFELLWDSKKE
ncbi:hypothetical protein DITRI_Ditri17bG0021200 [Diplodiscus trichospermus]